MSRRIRSALTVLAVALAAAMAAPGLPAAAADAPAGTAVRDLVPEVDERQCNVGERPRQIVLNLGIGGEEGQRCFGGTPGWTNIGRAAVYSVFTGDYRGAIECHNRFHQFGPNELVYPIDICTMVAIVPDCREAADAEACLAAAGPARASD